MPRRQRARSSEELKAEDFVDSVLNFGGGAEGEEEEEEGEEPAVRGGARLQELDRRRTSFFFGLIRLKPL